MSSLPNTNQSATTSANTTLSTSAPQGQTSILGDLLKTLGVGQQHIDDVHKATQGGNVNQQIDQAHSYLSDTIAHAREYAAKNPSAVLGGLSALVIAAGMMRNNMKR